MLDLRGNGCCHCLRCVPQDWVERDAWRDSHEGQDAVSRKAPVADQSEWCLAAICDEKRSVAVMLGNV